MASFYKFWLSFFQGAGIPPPYDSQYATAFNDNRIRPDMLPSVDKDMLAQMGVIAIGDKFAILKHAVLTDEKLRLSEIDGDIDFDPKLLEDTDDEEESEDRLVKSKTPLPEISPPLPLNSPPRPPPPPPLPPPGDPEPTVQPTVTFINNYTHSTQVQFYDANITCNQYPSSSFSHGAYVSHGGDGSTQAYGHGHGGARTVNAGDHGSLDSFQAAYFYSNSTPYSFFDPSKRFHEPPPPPPGDPDWQQHRRDSPRKRSRFSSPPPRSYSQHTPDSARGNYYRPPDEEPEPERVKRVFLYDPPPPRRAPRVPLCQPREDCESSRYYPPLTPHERELKVDTPIEGENVGYKMLQKLGWNKGGALGNGKGIKEPIRIEVRKGRMGLGANEFVQDFRAKKYVKFVTSVNPEERITHAHDPNELAHSHQTKN